VLFLVLAITAFSKAEQTGLKDVMAEWKKSDTIFSPKLLKFMLMLPTTSEDLNNKDTAKVHSGYDQVDVTDSELHVNDLVGSALTDFFAKGGRSD
jgi:hypothetical protein